MKTKTKQLIIMRGLPGSGKSTEAQRRATAHMVAGGKSVAICSTDDYHMQDDKYVFQQENLSKFHVMNQRLVADLMQLKVELIVVDNTNIKYRDMTSYRLSARTFDYEIEEVIIGEAQLKSENVDSYISWCVEHNTHNVPREVIERMAMNFESKR